MGKSKKGKDKSKKKERRVVRSDNEIRAEQKQELAQDNFDYLVILDFEGRAIFNLWLKCI